MKKQRLISIIALTVISALTLASCGKHKPDTSTDTDMSLAIYGGISFEVADGDVTKGFVITCSSPAQEDIIVNIDTAVPTSEAELVTDRVIIKKGTKTADGAIKFKLAAFPEKAPEKLILVRISTLTRDVSVDIPTTEFAVRGFIPLALEVEANGTEFNTFSGDVDYTITLSLTKVLEQDLQIRLRKKPSSSPVFDEQVAEETDLIIKAGNTQPIAQTFRIARGSEGILEMNILTDNETVPITIPDLTVTFTATEEPDPTEK